MKRTILLADDSVTIQKVVELTFLDEDVRVVSVGNGTDALARLAELRPDLVLADVHMPGADGYEVCAAARRELPGLPVLLLVGTFEIFDAERAAQAGAAGHLKKPFDSQELLRRVRELLAGGAAAAPAPRAPEPAFAFEPPTWEPAEETPAAPVAAESEAESWSFEPVAEPAADAPAPAPSPAESWSPLATTRFESPAPVSAAFEPEPEPESAFEPVEAPEPEPVAAAAPAYAAPAALPAAALSEADVERIARRVAELVSERAVREVAWEVVPDLAEVLLKARIRELEAAVE
jgi:CheY-like chemotaxis protein